MSKPVRRQGSAVYYARRVIPKDLQSVLGRREIWKSLDEKDYDRAKVLERRQQSAWDAEFEALQQRLKAAVEPPAPQHLPSGWR